MPSNGNPMVYGELRGSKSATVLNYNHYDVGPVFPVLTRIFRPRGTNMAQILGTKKGR